MKSNIYAIGFGIVTFALSFGACTDKIDDSNLYTFTGQTVETFIAADSSLSDFNYILQRSGLDRMMSTYGQYTCYAPVNSGVEHYIDSLYNDKESDNHNGMTSNSLEGLTDSLCMDIGKYHLSNGKYSIIDMGGSGATISTMLGRSISTKVDSLGETVLNNSSVIVSEDNVVTNGLVHKISSVVPRTTRLLDATFDRLMDYKIFTAALRATGLSDSIRKSSKGRTFAKPSDYTDTDGSELYCPTECKVGYTVFAETDKTFEAAGIHNLEDLAAYADTIYGSASNWYDYLNEKGKTVSTGKDYTNRFNALNMFIAYHILYASMAQDQFVFEDNAANKGVWNYVNGAEPLDYYETMLPNTLMKIWEPQPGKTLYINRYQTFNTLTNAVASMGTNHTLINPGIKIEREDIQAFNGYIHPIDGLLVYDKNVPKGVLKERLRFETTTYLPEFINNGFRYMRGTEVSALNGGHSGTRVAFPTDYFDNVVVYNGDQTKLRYNVKGPWRSYEADAFQGWGLYDLAVRLPHVPSGLYEFRLGYSPMDHGGMMQFYWGTSTDVQKMQALSIPLDVRISASDPRIGWTAFFTEADNGIASDIAMHNRGYMRGPYSFCGHPDQDGNQLTTKNCRGDYIVELRRVLGRVQIKQSEDFWFRFKNVINDDTDLKWQLDYVELVPVSVVDNDMYTEDWY